MRNEKGSSSMKLQKKKLLFSEVLLALHHDNNQIVASIGQTICIVYA